MNFIRKSLNSLVKLQQMFRIAETELGWKIRSESLSKPVSEFRALFFTFAIIIVMIIIMIMSVFLEHLSMLNMISCAEQGQLQKYKAHGYKSLKTAGVQTIMLKHPTKQFKKKNKPKTNTVLTYTLKSTTKNTPSHTN